MKRSVKIFWKVFFGGFIAFVLLVLLASWGVFGPMPSLKKLENPSILQATEVFADDGTLMGKYYLEKGNRSNVDYKDISKYVVDALVSTEDERFYNHSGIDFKSTLRAVMLLGREGGGSTLTQQLAKALLDHEGKKSKAIRVIQKLKEWIIAVKLERNFTKEEIIALYLNAVPFGNNVYGIRNASLTFFQKEPDRLKVEEAAVLVGMLKGNSIYNPQRNYKAAFDRRNVVLRQMVKNNTLTEIEYNKLKTVPIETNFKKLDENTGYAPYFREVLREDLKTILKGIKKPDGDTYDIYDDGLKIYTTINPRMQVYAEEAIAEWMPTMQKYLNATANIKNGAVWKEYEKVIQAAMKNSDRWANMKDDGFSDEEIKRAFNKKVPMKVFAWNAKREKDTVMSPYDSIKYHKQVMQASFMAMDPVTGEIKAWVGGVDFKTFKYDHVNIKTKRQVGSSIKPFLYAQAMEDRNFSPETPVEDVQQDFGSNRLVPATTKSCTGRTMTMASALAFSKNCASAYIMKQVTPKAFEEFVSRIGIPTDIGPHPANALGACDLSLYEMLWGYTVFAGRGFSTKPWYISRIEDRNGNVIIRFDYSVNRKEALNDVTAYKMVRMMQGTVDIGTAAGLRSRLGAAEMGGKTGTTNDNSDAWFMGYSPQLLAGVWVGCDDRFVRLNKNDTRGYGGTAARPIWESFYKKVYADKKLGIDRDARFSKPDDLELEMNSADPLNLLDSIPPPAAEGEDQKVNESDFEIMKTREYIGPESKPVTDDDKEKKSKKDTTVTQAVKIGDPQPEEKKKKGIFNKIFGKKEKKEN